MAIVPDDKDWTWVLQRPCPECGFDAAEVAREDVPRITREIAEKWQVVLGRPGVRDRPTPDMWSPLEYGCHVRDVFRLADFRVGLMLDHENPPFPNWDQDVTAVEDRYDEQDPLVVRRELAEAAETFAQRVAGVRDDQWGRCGVRSDGAQFTIESFGRYLVHDPIHHLWDVAAVG